MTFFSRNSRSGGFALMDALIAVVVLAGGMTAVAALNGRLASDSSTSKNRAQAVALAQEKIEELRTNLINDSTAGATNNFSGLTGGSDNCTDTPSPYSCGSAGFQRAWTITDADVAEAKNIQVTVSWTDSKNQAQSVVLSSIVAWDNPLMQVAASDDDDFAGLGGFPDPTGGGNLQFSIPDLDDANVVEENTEFGLNVVEYEGGVAVYDPNNTTTNQVWLTTDPGVIKITGTIVLSTVEDAEPNNFENATMSSELKSIAADAGICREIVNDNGTPEDTSDDYLNFLCYVGSNWYGRIGVMAINSSGQMENIEYVSGGTNADRLCPHTYRYRNNCEVTGEYSLGEPVNETYCESSDPNSDFIPVDDIVEAGGLASLLNTVTDNPMWFGTLTNQNFIIQDADTPCSGTLSISGTVTLTDSDGADAARGITANVVTATASGATSGCTLSEDLDGDDNRTTGSYVCYVPENWTGTIQFSAQNCSGAPVTDTYETAVTDEQSNEDVEISGCFGETLTISGTIANLGQAQNPEVTFNYGSVSSECTLELNEGAWEYTCSNIPSGNTVQIIATADNCPTLESTEVVNAENNDSVNLTWSGCEQVEYTIESNFTQVDGMAKWEIPTKIDVTPALVTTDSADNSLGSCVLEYVTSNKDYLYTCTITAYPNTAVTLTPSVCSSDSSQCAVVTPNEATVTLGNTSAIIGPTFKVSEL